MQFEYMNHMVGAIAFYNAGLNGVDTAAEMRKHVEELSDQDAKQFVQKVNDAPRIQKIACARLRAEVIAAIEDFGALCWAIRHRSNDGIYRRYVDSSVGEAANFHDHVLANPQDGLDKLLNLPNLASMQAALPTKVFAEVGKTYAAYPARMSSFANAYRQTPSVDLVDQTNLPATWANEVNILLGRPGQRFGSNKKSTFVLAANKIKHRFVVAEQLDTIAAEVAPDNPIPYLRHSYDATTADGLYQLNIGIAMYSANLAALLVLLDGHGVTV